MATLPHQPDGDLHPEQWVEEALGSAGSAWGTECTAELLLLEGDEMPAKLRHMDPLH